MKVSVQNAERRKWCKTLMDFLIEKGEDVDFIASNVFNFPAVTEEGEEYEIEITVKIPKSAEDDDCYAKRQSFRMKEDEKAEKAKEKAEAKAKKIAKDKKAREAKKKKE